MPVRVLVCHWCGAEFDRPHGRGPVPKFCRPSHRQRAFRSRRLDTDADGRERRTVWLPRDCWDWLQSTSGRDGTSRSDTEYSDPPLTEDSE